MWDPHYLQIDPIHDISLELKGPCAMDGRAQITLKGKLFDVPKSKNFFYFTLLYFEVRQVKKAKVNHYFDIQQR